MMRPCSVKTQINSKIMNGEKQTAGEFYTENINELHEKLLEIREARKEELRDRFAMAVITGTMANPEDYGTLESRANRAYRAADEMLKAREKVMSDSETNPAAAR